MKEMKFSYPGAYDCCKCYKGLVYLNRFGYCAKCWVSLTEAERQALIERRSVVINPPRKILFDLLILIFTSIMSIVGWEILNTLIK